MAETKTRKRPHDKPMLGQIMRRVKGRAVETEHGLVIVDKCDGPTRDACGRYMVSILAVKDLVVFARDDEAIPV